MELTLLFSLLLFILILMGLFAGSETGILSCSRLKVKNLAIQKDKKALVLDHLLNQKQKTIIILLVGLNITNILYTLVGDHVIHLLWFDFFGQHPSSTQQFLAATLILTPILVIFGEILPKTLFRYYSFSLTKICTPFIHYSNLILGLFSAPFIFLSSKAIGSVVSQTEYNKKTINLLVETGKVFHLQEQWIRKILSMSSYTLQTIMTPIPPENRIKSKWNKGHALSTLRAGFTGPLFIEDESQITNSVMLNQIHALPSNQNCKKLIENEAPLSADITCNLGLKQLLLSGKQHLIVKDKNTYGYVSLRSFLKLPEY